jgi:chitinase
LILCTSAAAEADGKRIVGYYWGKGRPGYQLSQVPAQKLTHLIYSRAMPNAEGDCVLAHPDVDLPNLSELKTLRVRNPGLFILLSVGGWSGSEFFSDLAFVDSARRRFSASCLALVQKYGFDGLDIDWEYPVTGGKPTDHKRASDKENFVLLLKQIRADLNASAHGRVPLLTIASTCYRNHLNDLSLKEMSAALDWFNLMCYDLDDMEPRLTAHGSALFSWRTQNTNFGAAKYANCDAAVRWYVDRGVPTDKIVLGVPFYGQIWAGVPETNAGLFEPYRTRPGDDGTLSFREIEREYLPTYRRHWDDQAKVPWLYKKETKIMISYEDPESIALKVRYVIQQNLGGMMFWDLGQDNNRATLLGAIYQQLAH